MEQNHMGDTVKTAIARPARQRRPPVRHEGARFRVAMTKADARLSFAIAPSATGYTLRARNRSKDGLKLAIEQFSEAIHGDSFNVAKKRVLELVAKAAQKGWMEKKVSRSIEDLF